MTQVVEHLHSKYQAVSSNPSTIKSLSSVVCIMKEMGHISGNTPVIFSVLFQ
jgi:hypothetical protein